MVNYADVESAAAQIAGVAHKTPVATSHTIDAETGATIFFKEGAFGIGSHPFRAPALPIEEVKDPTGAGDSFAGGFMGYIASQGELNREVLKRALFYGGVLGSFAVEEFGTERLQNLTRAEIDARFQIFRELTHLG